MTVSEVSATRETRQAERMEGCSTSDLWAWLATGTQVGHASFSWLHAFAKDFFANKAFQPVQRDIHKYCQIMKIQKVTIEMGRTWQSMRTQNWPHVRKEKFDTFPKTYDWLSYRITNLQMLSSLAYLWVPRAQVARIDQRRASNYTSTPPSHSDMRRTTFGDRSYGPKPFVDDFDPESLRWCCEFAATLHARR